MKWFFEWEKQTARNIYSEFQKGKFLHEDDIENIKDHLGLDVAHIKGISKKNKARNKVVNIQDTPQLVSTTPSVGRNHHYNRMTAVADYLNFIATLAVRHKNDAKLTASISKMHKTFRSFRPKGKGKNVLDKHDTKSLPEGLLNEFMNIAHFEHPKNPFKNAAIKRRNHLMFLLLKELGVRRGELLSLELTQMMLVGDIKYIWVKRKHDDKYDTRKPQPVAKTKERRLPIKSETAKLLDDYIMNTRALIPNANKHPYLFVTHKKCETQGHPISISTFDTIIAPAMRDVDERFTVIHTHYFRYDWNENFSEKVDTNNQLAKQEGSNRETIESGDEAKMRMHLMGHSSEKSAEPYNKRHVMKKANQVMLEEQEDLQRQLAESEKTTNKERE